MVILKEMVGLVGELGTLVVKVGEKNHEKYKNKSVGDTIR